MGCEYSTETAISLNQNYSSSPQLLFHMPHNNPESQNSITTTKLYQQSLLQQSIQHYKQIIELNPQIKPSFDGLGCIQDSIGYYEGKVVDWYRISKQKGLIKGNPYDALSLCYSIKEDYQEGYQWYLSMIEKYPTLCQLHFGLGNLYYKANRFSEAQEQYRKSIQLNPKLSKAYQNVAYIYCYHRYDNKQAEEWARFTLKINKNNHYAKLILTLVDDNTQIRYQRLLKLSNLYPKYARIHNSLGNTCLETGQNTQAIKWLSEAISINTEYFAPYCGLAIAYNAQKKHKEAIYMCLSALNINSKSFLPYASLAEAYFALGDIQAAKQNYRKCIEINSSFQEECNSQFQVQLKKEFQKQKQINKDQNQVKEIQSGSNKEVKESMYYSLINLDFPKKGRNSIFEREVENEVQFQEGILVQQMQK